MVEFLKKLFFISLLCCLTFSCSFLSTSTGNISFDIPNIVYRGVDDSEKPLFNISLKNSDNNYVYEKSTYDNKITILNLKPGIYYLNIDGSDKKFKYFTNGSIAVNIIAGVDSDINVELSKEKIPGKIEVVLSDFGQKVNIPRYTGQRYLIANINNPDSVDLHYQWQVSEINAGIPTEIPDAVDSKILLPNDKVGTRYYSIILKDSSDKVLEVSMPVEVEVFDWKLSVVDYDKNKVDNNKLTAAKDYYLELTNESDQNRSSIRQFQWEVQDGNFDIELVDSRYRFSVMDRATKNAKIIAKDGTQSLVSIMINLDVNIPETL